MCLLLGLSDLSFSPTCMPSTALFSSCPPDVSQVSTETASPAPVPSQLPTEMPASMPSAVSVRSASLSGHPAQKSEAEQPPLTALPPVSSGSPMPAVAPTEPINHESGALNNHMLVNGNRPHEVYQASEPHLDFDTNIIGDDLDDLLDNVTHEQTTEVQSL